MATTDFYELSLPVCDDSHGKTNWYICDILGDPYYLLNHTLHMGYLDDYPDKDFYFSTEAVIHSHAAKYYEHHGRDYPYISEWQLAVVTKNVKSTLAESQIMEFV